MKEGKLNMFNMLYDSEATVLLIKVKHLKDETVEQFIKIESPL